MKQLVILSIMALFGLVLFGCKKSPAPQPDEPDIPEPTLAEKFAQLEAHLEASIPLEIGKAGIEFKYNYPDYYNAMLIWHVSDESVLNLDGQNLLRKGYADVEISYEAYIGTETKSGTLAKPRRVFYDTIEDVETKFRNQFAPLITRDYELKDFSDLSATITWTSTHPEVFDTTGKYTQPAEDTPFEIQYTIDYAGKKLNGTLELTAAGIPETDKINAIFAWIQRDVLTDIYVQEGTTLNLPAEDPVYHKPITWTASNEDVVAGGTVHHFVMERRISLIARIEKSSGYAEKAFKLVVAPQAAPATKEAKIRNFLAAVAVSKIKIFGFFAYPDIMQSANHLMLYSGKVATFSEKLTPISSEAKKTARPGRVRTSVEAIAIHDTANTNATAGGQTHQNLLYNGYTNASWNYCVDEIGAWESIPSGEIAWHAGNGTGPGTEFVLTDTKVKATVKYPYITITEDGYYAFNGEKSVLKAPLIGGRIPTTDKITKFGLYSEIGANGNYYLNNNWYSKGFGYIANHGGNENAIGIETAVNSGTDYMQTARNAALLVAELMIKHEKLTLDRIMQHNTFSGKYCPRAIIDADYWNTFIDNVSIFHYALTELADVTFVWKSGDLQLMDNTGKIAKSVTNNTKLNYSVTATYLEDGTPKTITQDFTTTVFE